MVPASHHLLAETAPAEAKLKYLLTTLVMLWCHSKRNVFTGELLQREPERVVQIFS